MIKFGIYQNPIDCSHLKSGSYIKNRRGNTFGFTLMEVMVALMILGMGLSIIMSLQSTAIIGNAGVYRNIAATYLMHYEMTDLELHFRQEGFPEETVEGKKCDLPDRFDDKFNCMYDLIKLDIEPDDLNEMVNNSLSGLLGEDGISGLANMGMGKGGKQNMSKLMSNGGGDKIMSMLPVLAPFFGPDGAMFMQMCPINFSAILTNVMGASMFLPQVVKFAQERTRKLVVTLSWKEGYKGQKKITVEYFISSLPKEMIEMMKKKEMMDQMMDNGN